MLLLLCHKFISKKYFFLGEWLDEHRRNRITLGEKIGHDQDFMDVMLSLLDGTTIHGFDADTIIKARTLVC